VETVLIQIPCAIASKNFPLSAILLTGNSSDALLGDEIAKTRACPLLDSFAVCLRREYPLQIWRTNRESSFLLWIGIAVAWCVLASRFDGGVLDYLNSCAFSRLFVSSGCW
jgi:hypothetical protein